MIVWHFLKFSCEHNAKIRWFYKTSIIIFCKGYLLVVQRIFNWARLRF